MNNFNDNVFYSPELLNGGGYRPGVSVAPINHSITEIEKSRAVSEVQASLIIAKSQPRSEIVAENKMLQACKRLSLAESAIYSYKRGNAQVEGPSIRLAEMMARYWGNMTYGFKELGRDNEFSEVEAFAWDLETNTKVTRIFQVKHWRDLKGGKGYAVSEERDKYELVANYAQRRVRACILEIIPGDIVEAVIEECNATLNGQNGKPLKEKIQHLVQAFNKLGVNESMLANKIHHSLDSITETEGRNLQKIYHAIKDGYTTIEKEFSNFVTNQNIEDKPKNNLINKPEPQTKPEVDSKKLKRTPKDTFILKDASILIDRNVLNEIKQIFRDLDEDENNLSQKWIDKYGLRSINHLTEEAALMIIDEYQNKKLFS